MAKKNGAAYRAGYMAAYYQMLSYASNPFHFPHMLKKWAWGSGWRIGASARVNGERSMFQRTIERGL